jgi:protein-tyrosine phosphatase
VTGYVDLHAHVLPAVDDGPGSIADALALLSSMSTGGTATVAATSHVSEAYPNSAPMLDAARRELVDAVTADGLPISVVGGAEIELGMAMTLPDAELRALTINGTRWLLVEAPHARHPAGLPAMTADLRKRGFEVIIGHPERNPTLQRDPSVLREAVEAGAIAQVTGASIRGAIGAASQRAGHRFLEEGLAHLVASDAHDITARPGDMAETADVLAPRYGHTVAEALAQVVPAAILDGAPADVARRMVGPLRRRRILPWRR